MDSESPQSCLWICIVAFTEMSGRCENVYSWGPDGLVIDATDDWWDALKAKSPWFLAGHEEKFRRLHDAKWERRPTKRRQRRCSSPPNS